MFEKLKKYNRNDFNKRIGFMPGSRPSQIKRNLPVMLDLVEKIKQAKPNTEFCLILHKDLTGRIQHPHLNLITKPGNRYQAMKNCDFLVLCSGTASFEAAIMNIPQIFFNRPSFFDYYVFIRFLKTREYNLANLCFNKKIVPSFVSYKTSDILNNLSRLIASHISD